MVSNAVTVKQTTTMDKLERDLTFFKLSLEGEENLDRRRLILQQILDIKTQILNLTRQERARVQRENQIMQEALDKLGDPDAKKKPK